jgi:hypothetical protein
MKHGGDLNAGGDWAKEEREAQSLYEGGLEPAPEKA